MFEHMEIIKIIFGCVVTPSYLKNTQPKSNRTGAISKKRGESAFSNTHPMTDGGAGKWRKRYVDHSKRKSKTWLINGLGNYVDDFKCLWDFWAKYSAAQPTHDRWINPVPRKRFQ